MEMRAIDTQRKDITVTNSSMEVSLNSKIPGGAMRPPVSSRISPGASGGPSSRNPLDVKEILVADVFSGAVAPHGAAAEGQGGDQVIIEGSDGAVDRRLVPDDPVGGDREGKLFGNLLVLGEDHGRVPGAAEFQLTDGGCNSIISVIDNKPAEDR